MLTEEEFINGLPDNFNYEIITGMTFDDSTVNMYNEVTEPVNTLTDAELTAMEAEVLAMVNSERAKEGLSALSAESLISQAADIRAREITEVFSHDRPDGTTCFTALDELNVPYRRSGENIAYGQDSAAEVMEGWMGAPGHRDNMLRSYFNTIGIGCYEHEGILHWVQMFTN